MTPFTAKSSPSLTAAESTQAEVAPQIEREILKRVVRDSVELLREIFDGLPTLVKPVIKASVKVKVNLGIEKHFKDYLETWQSGTGVSFPQLII